jgi:hypothetical protein
MYVGTTVAIASVLAERKFGCKLESLSRGKSSDLMIQASDLELAFDAYMKSQQFQLHEEWIGAHPMTKVVRLIPVEEPTERK